jgi:hypothetical protein
MESNYWSKLGNQRVGRRRALAFSGGALAASAFLAACGDGGGAKQSEGGDKSGLISKPADTTGQAKQGGVIKDFFVNDAPHFDAAASNASGVINWVSSFAYPQMVKLTPP